MTQEEIKKAAIGCAENWNSAHPEHYNVLDTRIKEGVIHIMSNLVEELSKDYCIVPKEIVLQEYKNVHSEDIGRSVEGFMRESMLKRIFGAELFEEGK